MHNVHVDLLHIHFLHAKHKGIYWNFAIMYFNMFIKTTRTDYSLNLIHTARDELHSLFPWCFASVAVEYFHFIRYNASASCYLIVICHLFSSLIFYTSGCNDYDWGSCHLDTCICSLRIINQTVLIMFRGICRLKDTYEIIIKSIINW